MKGRPLAAAAALLLAAAPGAGIADVLKGVVRSTSGTPVADADFDVFALDGTLLPPDDNSDADGTYEILLGPGRYDLVCEPPLSSGLAPQAHRGLLVGGETRLDWALPPAVRVLGRVLGPAGPVAGADLDFDREADGARQPALGDLTNLFGAFAAWIEAGTYRVTAFPPPTSGLAPARLEGVGVPTTDTLRFQMVTAVHLSGRVRDPAGQGVGGVRLAFDDAASGARVPALDNRTAADGSYAAALAPGSYRVLLAPPRGTRLVAQRRGPLDLSADATLDVALQEGWLLSGTVLDPSGRPLAGADWDAADEATGTSVPLGEDATDYDGRFSLGLPAGVYRLTLTPPPGPGLDTLVLRQVAVSGDTTVDVRYGGTGPATTRLAISPVQNPSYRGGEYQLFLPADGEVHVELFDLAGRRIRTLERGWLAAGTYRRRWDGRNVAGLPVGASVYLLRLGQNGAAAVARWISLP